MTKEELNASIEVMKSDVHRLKITQDLQKRERSELSSQINGRRKRINELEEDILNGTQTSIPV